VAKIGGSYKNVFDDQNEFDKLNNLIIGAVQQFSEYRKGNITYGEIMFVLESVLDSMRSTSESDAKTYRIKGMRETPSFGTLYAMTGRMVETLVKKGLIDSKDEAFILHGEK
jgi:hypothetical protein